MKQLFFLLPTIFFLFQIKAQPTDCRLKPPVITIHFGQGEVQDINTATFSNYTRISGYCPRDGYYAYTGYTSDCFSGDWLTLATDHTPGKLSGNMMLVNSSHRTGTFFSTTLNGLKGSTTYELGLWLMNVCRISDKCPFPLLPDITVRLQTETGKTVAQFRTGEIERLEVPNWKRHMAYFTTPPSMKGAITLIMSNNNPGGCGNDFALDDITFRECIKHAPVVSHSPKPIVATKKSPPSVLIAKPRKAVSAPVKMQPRVVETVTREKDRPEYSSPVLKQTPVSIPPPPVALTTRTNSLVKQIETEAGEINISLYDNGEIDGDTVSIYHNNVLLKSKARLSQKPLSFNIALDDTHPHHELVMVAENLGSIPPNTSMMIITAGSRRYEVFISSNEQKNAKVIFDLKK